MKGCRTTILLDGVIFAGNRNPVRDVMVGGNGWCRKAGTRPKSGCSSVIGLPRRI